MSIETGISTWSSVEMSQASFQSGYGLFWFKGDGKGGWRLMRDSGLPTRGLGIPHGIALADLDRDGVPEIVSLHAGSGITVWRRP